MIASHHHEVLLTLFIVLWTDGCDALEFSCLIDGRTLGFEGMAKAGEADRAAHQPRVTALVVGFGEGGVGAQTWQNRLNQRR